jgi:hypothetical protein
MLNVMWQIHINGFRFDFLLACLTFLTWFKLFIYFRASVTFGPMFKILQQMMVDLAKFLCIWAIILIMFVCVGMLAFGQLEDFKNMTDILIYFVEAALGEWDMDVFNGTNHDG